MRMLVLGAGLQGSACAYDLLQAAELERLVLADLRVDGVLPPFLEQYGRDPRMELRQLDARDDQAVRSAMADVDCCLNALPYYFNLDITRAAIEAGVHCCDLGGNTGIVFDQLALTEQAETAGVSAVPDCGLAPGMVNILAALGISMFDAVESVQIRVGGLPQHPTPPLNYQIVYSLEGVLDYYTTPAWVVRAGRPVQVDALSEIELVEFPAPVGTLEAFQTAGGLSTMPWTQRGIPSMDYKTLRYPGHAEIMRTIRDLGLLDLKPVELPDGSSAVPRDVFVACAEPRLRRPAARDLVALRVIVTGEKDGGPGYVGFDLVDYFDESTGISAMERATGFSLSITGQMQVRGDVAGPGVLTPDIAVPGEPYVRALAQRGIAIEQRLVTPAEA